MDKIRNHAKTAVLALAVTILWAVTVRVTVHAAGQPAVQMQDSVAK